MEWGPRLQERCVRRGRCPDSSREPGRHSRPHGSRPRDQIPVTQPSQGQPRHVDEHPPAMSRDGGGACLWRGFWTVSAWCSRSCRPSRGSRYQSRWSLLVVVPFGSFTVVRPQRLIPPIWIDQLRYSSTHRLELGTHRSLGTLRHRVAGHRTTTTTTTMTMSRATAARAAGQRR